MGIHFDSNRYARFFNPGIDLAKGAADFEDRVERFDWWVSNLRPPLLDVIREISPMHLYDRVRAAGRFDLVARALAVADDGNGDAVSPVVTCVALKGAAVAAGIEECRFGESDGKSVYEEDLGYEDPFISSGVEFISPSFVGTRGVS